MAMLCIDRLKRVLAELEEEGICSKWVDSTEQSVEVVDNLNGGGRFTAIAEVIGGSADIAITVRLFTGITGEPEARLQAFEYLLNLNAEDQRVTISVDRETGAVGASVTFSCHVNLRELQRAVMHHLRILTIYLEQRYDRIFADLLEFGVTFSEKTA